MPNALLEGTRRHLSPRQAELVQALCDAAVSLIRENGYEAMSVRGAARAAGIAPATAYTYFSSKEHLVAEAFWRRMHELPPPSFGRTDDVRSRVSKALDQLAVFIASEPEFSAACTSALLAGSPDVRQLRDRIALEINSRLSTALGDMARPDVMRALELAYTGAMLWAGMGHMRFDELPSCLGDVARLVLSETP